MRKLKLSYVALGCLLVMGSTQGAMSLDIDLLQSTKIAMSAKQDSRKEKNDTKYRVNNDFNLTKDIFSGKRDISDSYANYEKSVVIVQYKNSISLTDFLQRCQAYGLQDLEIKQMSGLSKALGKSVFILKSTSIDTPTLIKKLQQDPNIEKVQPSYRRELLQSPNFPNDANFSQLWGLHNTGQEVRGIRGVVDADIDAPEAWEIETGNKNVVVAVFDTGVDYKHEDLKDNMWVNEAELNGQSGVDDDNNGYVDDIYGYDFGGNNDSDPMDEFGHGTHVAGTIGAKGNNTKGVTGVNWDVSIMALKIFADQYAYDSDIVEAIDYVMKMKDKGVNIVAINASYGGYGGSQDDIMNDLIKILGSKDIVFCAAAGNEAFNNDYYQSFPASYDAPNIIAVDASDINDTITYFSNYGYAATDIFAPGNNILSTIPGATVADVVEWHTHDDFESGVDNWNSQSPWSLTEADSYSPTHSWTTGAYENNQNASLTYNVTLDLQNYMQNAEENESVIFGACFKGELEQYYDKVYLEYSADGGNSWKTGSYVSGLIPDWSCFYQEINDLSDQNRVRFRFYSDSSYTKSGYFLDDFFIAKAQMVHNRYAYYAGTSMATPHVTGAVALMAAHYPNENVYERVARILDGADKKTSFAGFAASKGRLNLASSLQIDELPPYIMDVNETQGIKEGKLVKIIGVHFGDSQGRVYFETNGSQTVDAQVISWSDSEIVFKAPKLQRANFLRVEASNGKISPNTSKVTKWKIEGQEETRHIKGAAVAVGSKIYRIGGVDDPTSVDIYDTKTKRWSAGRASPFTHTDGIVQCAPYEGNIYCLGQDVSGRVLFAKYNVQSDSWSQLDAPSTTFYDGYGVVSTRAGIHVIGGLDADRNVQAVHLLYNLSSNKWQEKSPLPEARAYMTLHVMDGKIYLFGGIDEDGEISNKSFAFDDASNDWTTLADVPVPIAAASSMAFQIDNTNIIAIIGGVGVDGNRMMINEKIFLFEPGNNTWETSTYSPFMPNFNLRYFASSVRVEDSVYLFGGVTYQPFDAKAKNIESVYAPMQTENESDIGSGDESDNNDGGSGGGGGGLPAGNPWVLLVLFLGFTLYAARRIASSRA